MNKDKLISTVNQLDDPISLDDLLDKILLLEKIEKGIEQSENDQVIPDDELDGKIGEWLI